VTYDRDSGYEKGKQVQTGPLDIHEAQQEWDDREEPTSTEGAMGTSNQFGAGRAELPRSPRADDGAIEDSEEIVTPSKAMRMDPSVGPDVDESDVDARTAGHVEPSSNPERA
jgi:hypothetical protein